MQVIVNGETRQIAAGCTLKNLLKTLDIPVKNIAIELNGTFLGKEIPWEKPLSDGDRLELVQFVGGG